jgi:hypothetical protein
MKMNNEMCDFCQEREGTIQVMYPTFDPERPDMLFPCCAKCAKRGEDPLSDIVIPTEEEMLRISLGYKVTNEKMERIRGEIQEIIENFMIRAARNGFTLTPLEEEPPI